MMSSMSGSFLFRMRIVYLSNRQKVPYCTQTQQQPCHYYGGTWPIGN